MDWKNFVDMTNPKIVASLQKDPIKAVHDDLHKKYMSTSPHIILPHALQVTLWENDKAKWSLGKLVSHCLPFDAQTSHSIYFCVPDPLTRVFRFQGET
jgi:hypothetical protein